MDVIWQTKNIYLDVILPKGHTVPAHGAGAASGRRERPKGVKNPRALLRVTLSSLSSILGNPMKLFGRKQVMYIIIAAVCRGQTQDHEHHH
jgi:hypothetical protein